ncbi:MAG: hypothetical protein V9G09_05920 [Candidatus Nanopelagicales bacterium]
MIAAEFAEVVRSGRSHELDAHRGLFLQRLLQHAAPPSGARVTSEAHWLTVAAFWRMRG